MGLAGVALAISIFSTGPAAPGAAPHQADDLIRSFGEAVAFQKACPTVVVDQGYVARTLAKAGIRLAPLIPSIQSRQPYHDMALANLDLVSACKLARLLYGESGLRAAGFLTDR